MKKALVVVAVITAVLSVCIGILYYSITHHADVDVPAALRGGSPGDLVMITRTGFYPAVGLQWAVDNAELEDEIHIEQGFTAYRLAYSTTNVDGNIVVASGLVALPNLEKPRGVVVFHHGTTAQRDTAPSSDGSEEGLLVSAVTCGAGHILLAPDYIGLGISEEPHPYLHTATTVSTSVDFLTATKRWLESRDETWPKALFLTGFSQGGLATLALQRHLEISGSAFSVSASAPIAGPFNLRDISFPQALTGTTDSHEFYLGYLTSAYARMYKQPLSSLLKTSYAAAIPSVFDGNQSMATINAALPESPREMFTSEFMECYSRNCSHWFLDALEENSLKRWETEAPIRAFYGDRDIDVLPDEAFEMQKMLGNSGGGVEVLSVGPLDHIQSVRRGVPLAIRWFSSTLD